ncbi:hypothetical protein [Rhodoferax sp.]|uniref:hypothetical protein n=1 Tax=Rhodoferax sp. TaxID=50421 RepID=UPI0025DAD33C|nr:hypothetical protein [Rhodoferax sp.]
MFITNNASRSPVSNLLGDPAAHYWGAAELALCRPWFLVTFLHTESIDGEDAFSRTRTMLLSNVEDVESMAQQETGGSLQFESVQVITPGHLNGTGGWKMEPLDSVWTAEEPSVAGQVVEIYETKAGVKYAVSMLGTPVDELRKETLWLRFPVLEENHGCLSQ